MQSIPLFLPSILINARKTVVMCQLPPVYPQTEHNVLVGDETILHMDQFTCLGSIQSSSRSITNDIQNRMRQASADFSNLSGRVLLNRNLSIKTKVAIYLSICISILLFGSKMWAIYREEVRCFETFRFGCLQRILGITWKDRAPHVQILQRTKPPLH